LKVEDSIKHHYQSVVNWNASCGTKFQTFGTQEWKQAIELQSALLVEEASETFVAAKDGNLLEILDGAVDTFVILSYLFAQLEQAGFNVDAAIDKVMDNNYTKIYESYYLAVAAKESLEEWSNNSYYVETSMHEGMPYYTVRNAAGKVQKPLDFVAVNLHDCLPITEE
jgi:hypothetical protein